MINDGLDKILPEVRSVPDLKRNLISLGPLDKGSYSYKSEGRVLQIYKGSLLKMKGTSRNGLYFQGSSINSHEVNTVDDVISVELVFLISWYFV